VRAWTVGVRLQPGAIPALTGLAAHELTDAELPVAELSHPGTGGLLGWLEQADTPAAAADVLLVFLRNVLGRADAATRRTALLLDMLRNSHARSVRQLADELGLAERTLHHVCVTRIGLAPQRILRIVRLQRALQHALDSRDGWARVAALHGYADQSHLTRDFRGLLGEPPGEFVRRARAH
jgi:AraC-like DNA-binding protein